MLPFSSQKSLRKLFVVPTLCKVLSVTVAEGPGGARPTEYLKRGVFPAGTEQRRAVVRIVGEHYDKQTFANDIALLQLERRLNMDSKHVAPICVPRPGHHYRTGE